MDKIKDEKARRCGHCKPDVVERGVIFTQIFQDNWFVKHCNRCNYWKAGFLNKVN